MSGTAAGLAEVDETKAATTARTIAEETRIVCESCDLRSDDFEEDSGTRRTAGLYAIKILLYEIHLRWLYFHALLNEFMIPISCQLVPKALNIMEPFPHGSIDSR